MADGMVLLSALVHSLEHNCGSKPFEKYSFTCAFERTEHGNLVMAEQL